MLRVILARQSNTYRANGSSLLGNAGIHERQMPVSGAILSRDLRGSTHISHSGQSMHARELLLFLSRVALLLDSLHLVFCLRCYLIGVLRKATFRKYFLYLNPKQTISVVRESWHLAFCGERLRQIACVIQLLAFEMLVFC